MSLCILNEVCFYLQKEQMYVTTSIRFGIKYILGWSMFEPSESDTFAIMLERLIAEISLTDEALSQYQPACSIRETNDTVSDVAV